jgi:predicted glutamine amidotransferase
MCELFCLSSRQPTRTTFSLRHFAAHGAPNTRNIDGWGVAFHDGRDVRLFKEPEPAGDSVLLGFIEHHLQPTQLLISHIRRATVGGNSHANTQPFMRELGGRIHLFAHNGGFHGIEGLFARSVHRFHPVGETDSEKGFCLLLDRLIKIWEGAMPPLLAARLAIVEAFAAEMRPLGIANFLYSDGEFVFGHGHRRTQADGIVAPAGAVGAPQPPQRRPCCRDRAAGGVGRHHPSGRAGVRAQAGNGPARQRAGDRWPLVAAGRGRGRRAVRRETG